MMCNNPNLDLVNINAYTKFGKILSICSQDIELKRNSEQNSDINQGQNSVKNEREVMHNNPISMHKQNLLKFY